MKRIARMLKPTCMKFSDRISLIGAANNVIVALIPYFTLFFRWDEQAENRAEQLLILGTIVALYLVSVFYGRRIRNAAWVEGFARGYFYNFIYETADMILDREATITLGDRVVQTAACDREAEGMPPVTGEYAVSEVRLLIIQPGGLYAAYRTAELMSALFEEAVVSPGKHSRLAVRKKFMKAYELKKEGQKRLLLIDCPPTTLRAMKLHQESRFNIDHNDPYDTLDPKAQKRLSQIRKRGRKRLVPIFGNALEHIVNELTRGSRDQRYKDLILRTGFEDLLQGILDPGQYESLAYIGDNLGAESRKEKARVRDLLRSRQTQIEARLEKLVAGD